MNHFSIIRVSALSVACLTGSASLSAATTLKTDKDKVSYIIGHQIGSSLSRDGLEVDIEVLAKGIKAAIAGEKSQISQEDSRSLMANLQKTMQAKAEAKMKVQGEKNSTAGKAFLEKNAKASDVKTLPSGLQYKVLAEGKGTSPVATDTVSTNYKGTLIDGTEFDSSYKRGQPAKFPVNGVIKGWTEALQLMKPGAKWQLFVPSDLAYGPGGSGEMIGPNSTLIFDIELLGIEPKVVAPTATAPSAPAAAKEKTE